MKFFIIILPFLSLLTFTQAQKPWDLFPVGQRTWWRSSTDSLKLFYCDSLEASGSEEKIHHFGKKYIVGNFGDSCLQHLLTTPPTASHPPPFFPPREFYHPMISDSAGVWRFSDASEPFIFHSEYMPGQSWTLSDFPSGSQFSGAKIECTALDTIYVFGYPTAAKYFELSSLPNPSHPLNGFVFILTEKFGFTRFAPLFSDYGGLNKVSYNMIGFEKGGISKGLVPSFTSFFGNYKAGDIYRWLETYSNPGHVIRYWHTDSLTSVYIFPDSIITRARRQTKLLFSMTSDTSYSTSTIFTKFSLSDYQAMLDAAPGWYWIEPNASPKYLIKTWGTFDTSGHLRIDVDFQAGRLKPNKCELDDGFPSRRQEAIHEKLGLVYRENGSSASTRQIRLLGIGYEKPIVIDTIVIDTVVIDTVVIDTLTDTIPKPILKIAVYPNPSNGLIKIEWPEEVKILKNSTVEISDSQGKIYLTLPNYTEDKIELYGMGTGIYFIRIFSPSYVFCRRFLYIGSKP